MNSESTTPTPTVADLATDLEQRRQAEQERRAAVDRELGELAAQVAAAERDERIKAERAKLLEAAQRHEREAEALAQELASHERAIEAVEHSRNELLARRAQAAAALREAELVPDPFDLDKAAAAASRAEGLKSVVAELGRQLDGQDTIEKIHREAIRSNDLPYRLGHARDTAAQLRKLAAENPLGEPSAPEPPRRRLTPLEEQDEQLDRIVREARARQR